MIKETQLTEELKRAKEERDAEIKRGKQEAVAIIEETKNDSVKLRLKLEEEAKEQIAKMMLLAKEDADKRKEKIIKETHELSLSLAVEMIEKTFTDENKEDLQGKFINDTIKELAAVPQDRFPAGSGSVKVISSFPLKENQRENLKNILSEKLGVNLTLDEAVNRELISGLLIEMNGLIIDGSLKNRLRQVIPLLKKN